MLRPGSSILRRRGLRPGAPRIDWRNPIAFGLTGVYLPGLGTKRVQEFSGLGISPTCGTSLAFVSTQEGRALDTSAQGAGQGCNGVATSAQQPTKTASVFWRGILLGTPTLNEYIFGVEFGDGNTTPFDAYDLTYMNTGAIQSATNVAGVNHSVTTVASVALNVPIDAATVVDMAVTGTIFSYYNGVVGTTDNTLGTTGPINYGTNPQLQIGGTSSAGQNACNARHLVGYTWNRVLAAAEVAALHADPYQLLIFPQDEILAFLASPAASINLMPQVLM